MSAPTWDEEFELSDRSYSVSDNQDYFEFITRVRGQYRYSRYLQDVIGWKLRHSGQYVPVLPTTIATAELFKYDSIKFKQTHKNVHLLTRSGMKLFGKSSFFL